MSGSIIVAKNTEYMDTKLGFNEINEAFAPYSQLESASFVQGMLVGQVSSTPSLTEPQWIKRLVDEGGMGSIKESFLVVLHQIYHETLAGLNSADCDLNLLLPDDQEAVALRVRYLADWCEGFLYGMGLGTADNLSKEVSEVLSDFGEISMVELPELDKESEAQAEADLMELTEFVRMGAIMIYDELNPVEQQKIDIPANEKPTLH